jgi:hypothetical protein
MSARDRWVHQTGRWRGTRQESSKGTWCFMTLAGGSGCLCVALAHAEGHARPRGARCAVGRRGRVSRANCRSIPDFAL